MISKYLSPDAYHAVLLLSSNHWGMYKSLYNPSDLLLLDIAGQEFLDILTFKDLKC